MLDADQLQHLFGILRELHFIYEPDQLWRYVLERSCSTLNAQGASFFKVTEGGRMELAAAVGVDEERLRRVPMRLGTGICGWVAEHQEAVLVEDARSDSRFNPMADEITGSLTQSLLCIPIFSQKETYGVLELINRRGGPFQLDDQEFMSLLGTQTAVAYQNLVLMREISQTKQLFENLLVNMTGGLIAIDAKGDITVFNPAAKDLLLLPTQAVVGKPAVAVLMDYPILLSILHKTLNGEKVLSRQEAILPVKGQNIRFGYSTIPISDPQKRSVGSAVIFQRLT